MPQVVGTVGDQGESPPTPLQLRSWDGNCPVRALFEVEGRFPEDTVRDDAFAWAAPTPGGEPPPRLTGPLQFVVKLLKSWKLSMRDAVGLLGFREEDRDYVEDVLRGKAMFRGRDVSDRIANLFWIRNLLRSLFRSVEEENLWMRERHEKLDDKSPLSLIVGGTMEDLLLVKEYVEWVCRR